MKKMLIAAATYALFTSCVKKEDAASLPLNNELAAVSAASVVAAPVWKAEARCFLDGPSGAFDDVAVKDPSMVYSGGRYHLFYTGRNVGTGGLWRMGYTSATTIAGLNSGTRTYMSALDAGSYFCAPQVFWFPVKGKWFLIYQSGLGASFSTSTDVGNPALWTANRAMGFTDGIDFWCIADDSYVYCFYSAQDASRTIKRRRTTIANFPYNWEAPTVVATATFEAPHVYKNKADGKFYMVVEDINRYQELWTANTLGRTWTKVAEKWAAKDNLTFLAEQWTDQVSHVEVLRASNNDRMEVDNFDRCQMIIQGVKNGNYPDYGSIPYDLGIIRNY